MCASEGLGSGGSHPGAATPEQSLMFTATLPRIPVIVPQRRCACGSACCGRSSSLAPGPQGAAHVVLGRPPRALLSFQLQLPFP